MPGIALELGKLTTSIGAKNSYGEPMEVDGASYAPVAMTWSGFGGWNESASKEGGGGGGASIPLGVYVKTSEGLRFQPNIVSFIAVAIPFVWVTGKALSKVIRALKR